MQLATEREIDLEDLAIELPVNESPIQHAIEINHHSVLVFKIASIITTTIAAIATIITAINPTWLQILGTSFYILIARSTTNDYNKVRMGKM